MDNIRVRVGAEEGDGTTTKTQKVTVPVDPDSWRVLKVYCAHHDLKLTDHAGKIIKEWVDINVSV